MKITYLFFLLTALLPLNGIAQTANSLADDYLQKGLQLTEEQQLEAANSALDSAYQLFITAKNYEQGIKTLETITDNLNQLGQLQKIEPRITSALKEELSVTIILKRKLCSIKFEQI